MLLTSDHGRGYWGTVGGYLGQNALRTCCCLCVAAWVAYGQISAGALGRTEVVCVRLERRAEELRIRERAYEVYLLTRYHIQIMKCSW